MTRERRRTVLLVALAGALLAAAALLFSSVEDAPLRTRRAAVEFPRYPREHEQARRARRATLALPAPPSPPGEPARPPRLRDPFLVALPAGPDDPVVVLEANALRHSRLGELLVGCLLARDPRALEALTEETGVDVLADVDRVAFAGEAVVVSGFFDRVRWDRFETERGVSPTPYGDGGLVYAAGEGEPAIGRHGDGLVVFGDEASVRRAIDQVEGRVPAPPSAIPDELAYGEIYGVVPGEAARRLLRPGDDRLAAQLAAVAQRIELHVDAMHDVAAVVRVRGDDGAGLEDLSRTLGGALAAARLEASALDDARLAELLDHARVAPGDGSFALEVALPADRLEAWFERCRPPAAAAN